MERRLHEALARANYPYVDGYIKLIRDRGAVPGIKARAQDRKLGTALRTSRRSSPLRNCPFYHH